MGHRCLLAFVKYEARPERNQVENKIAYKKARFVAQTYILTRWLTKEATTSDEWHRVLQSTEALSIQSGSGTSLVPAKDKFSADGAERVDTLRITPSCKMT
ncbi:uncharacterized protein PHALS_04260 [Plasmopara halstedii]|uniref:Uncharacterized protein n=1 Tax=Plasmopara halstedii TaxID=4781 RepID=A0A0P1B245_PLAHL|nr:uncharacterized protein PHALS_04260 [Plasmopara halstedii]CEG47380.1 hypothetical protein PHALS_04260 [Plasmopara halstedii]|eukprot:XP_024583749.1 hypothetical protein PHALS_04260 [Plasmopara halstedii]